MELLRRLLVPGLLVVAGTATLIYGAVFHHRDVVQEQQVERITPPARRPPTADPRVVPEPPRITTEIVLIPMHLTEPALLREIAVGGLSRLPTGELRQALRSGSPLCPT